MASISEVGGAFQFNGDRRRQRGDAECGPAGCARRVREVFGPHRVVAGEVAGHVGQIHGHIGQLLPARAAGFQHRADIGHHLMGLRADVMTDQPAIGVVDVAGDGVAGRVTRADAGEQEPRPAAARVRVGADRLRRGGGGNRGGHRRTVQARACKHKPGVVPIPAAWSRLLVGVTGDA